MVFRTPVWQVVRVASVSSATLISYLRIRSLSTFFFLTQLYDCVNFVSLSSAAYLIVTLLICICKHYFRIFEKIFELFFDANHADFSSAKHKGSAAHADDRSSAGTALLLYDQYVFPCVRQSHAGSQSHTITKYLRIESARYRITAPSIKPPKTPKMLSTILMTGSLENMWSEEKSK